MELLTVEHIRNIHISGTFVITGFAFTVLVTVVVADEQPAAVAVRL